MLTRIASLLVLALFASSCSSGPTLEQRLDAVAAARAALAEPARTLGEAATQLGVRLDQVEVHPGAAELTVLDEAIADLRTAASAMQAVEILTEVDLVEVQLARDVATEAGVIGMEVVGHAEVVSSMVASLIAVDAELLEISEAWHESGSRRQQIEHFGGLAERAAALLADLQSRGHGGSSCGGEWPRRAALASLAEQTSRELQEMVESYQGTTFDERRAALRADSFGLGEGVTLPTPMQAAGCDPLVDARAGGTDVIEALMRLQDALNPAELST